MNSCFHKTVHFFNHFPEHTVCTADKVAESHVYVSTKYVGQNHNIITDNKSFKIVVKFKHLGMILINQNHIHKKITSTLNLVNVCYLSLQILSSNLLPKNTNIKIFNTVILFFHLHENCGLSH
jgi:hypothetical protein